MLFTETEQSTGGLHITSRHCIPKMAGLDGRCGNLKVLFGRDSQSALAQACFCASDQCNFGIQGSCPLPYAMLISALLAIISN